MAHSKRNLVAALQDAFPELQLKQKGIYFTLCALTHILDANNSSEIGTHNKDLWKEIENCRKFFDQLAQEMQFDPLQASNWHSLNISSVYRHMKVQRELDSKIYLTPLFRVPRKYLLCMAAFERLWS